MWYSQSEGSGRCSRRIGTRWLCRPQREERTKWGNRRAQPEGLRARSFGWKKESRGGEQEETTTKTVISGRNCDPTQAWNSHSVNNYQSLWREGTLSYITKCSHLSVASIQLGPTFPQLSTAWCLTWVNRFTMITIHTETQCSWWSFIHTDTQCSWCSRAWNR